LQKAGQVKNSRSQQFQRWLLLAGAPLALLALLGYGLVRGYRTIYHVNAQLVLLCH
jgi:type II secretory pathway component PulL